MIVAFSTSSPMASVAIVSLDGNVLAERSMEAPQRASSACIELLDACLLASGKALSEASLFAADIGPGSFTGTRVGVIMAKTLAFDQGCPCAGATSFDLIDPSGRAFVPSKKGEWLLREPGREPARVGREPLSGARGYGLEGAPAEYPSAAGFAQLLGSLVQIRPEGLMPYYFHEPSISKPNKPFKTLGGDR